MMACTILHDGKKREQIIYLLEKLGRFHNTAKYFVTTYNCLVSILFFIVHCFPMCVCVCIYLFLLPIRF